MLPEPDYEQAQRWADEAVELSREDADSLYHLALVYLQAGAPEKSVPLLEQALGRLEQEEERFWVDRGQVLDSMMEAAAKYAGQGKQER